MFCTFLLLLIHVVGNGHKLMETLTVFRCACVHLMKESTPETEFQLSALMMLSYASQEEIYRWICDPHSIDSQYLESDLYFPAGSVDSSHHAPQYWKQKETNTWLTGLWPADIPSGGVCLFTELQILTVEVGVPAVQGQAVVSEDLVLVCEEVRAPDEGRVEPVEALQPQVLKHSIDRWSCVTTHVSIRLMWSSFTCSTGAGPDCPSPVQTTGTPNGRNVFSLFLLHRGGLFCSTAPVHSSGFVAPSWLPVLHYRKDNHHVHEPQEMH